MLIMKASDAQAIALQNDIQKGNVESLQRELHENAALVTARVVDRSGVSRTLLHIGADWPGHLLNGAQVVGILAAAGADVNARVGLPDPNTHRETALHWAASSDDVAVLDALLDAGADIEATGAVFTDGTAMSDAVIFAQWRAAHRLLERGADMHWIGYDRKTPSDVAAESGSDSLIQWLRLRAAGHSSQGTLR